MDRPGLERRAARRAPARVILFLLMLGLCASGCATHSVRAERALRQFRAGDTVTPIQYYESRVRDRQDRQLNLVEAGRLHMLDGNFAASQTNFTAAIDEVIEMQDGAVVRVGTIGSTLLASTLANETAIHYQLPAYEIGMAFQYQAMNNLFIGDLDAAAVEMRRAVYVQDMIAGQREAEIAKAEADAKEKHADGLTSVSDKYATMAPTVGRVKRSFQNSLTWYMSGVLYESQGDDSNAYIAYKKAWELVPGNRHVQRDVLRLAAAENPDQQDSFQERFGHQEQRLGSGSAEIVLVFEENFISRQRSVSVPLLIAPGNWQSLMFPVYEDFAYVPMPVDVRLDDVAAGSCEPVCYVQSLAYAALQEKLPGLVMRNITRAVTRSIAVKAMQDSDNGYAQLAGAIWNIGTAVGETADTRAWYSLPMVVQVYRRSIEPGSHSLRLVNRRNGQAMTLPFHVAPGEKKFLWAADMYGRAVTGAASLTHPRQAGTFARSTGILAYPVFGGGGDNGPLVGMDPPVMRAVVPCAIHQGADPCIAGCTPAMCAVGPCRSRTPAGIF